MEFPNNCETCGRIYTARRRDSRFCNDTCRKRAARFYKLMEWLGKRQPG